MFLDHLQRNRGDRPFDVLKHDMAARGYMSQGCTTIIILNSGMHKYVHQHGKKLGNDGSVEMFL